MTTTYLITGGGRGIGLELTRQLSLLPTTSLVFTTTRSVAPPDALAAVIAASGDKVVHLSADAKDTQSMQAAAKVVQGKLGGKGLDVLVNNVGEVGGMYPYKDGGVAGMPAQKLIDTFSTNVVSAHVTTSAFLELLRKGERKKVVNLSTSMSSFALAPAYAALGKGGLPAYFTTKTALNMLTVQYALDYGREGFTIAALSPGDFQWVKTDLGSQWADLEQEPAVRAIVEVIENKSGPEKNGKFLDIEIPGWDAGESPSVYDGKEIPW